MRKLVLKMMLGAAAPASLAAPTSATWYKASSDHFVVYSEGSADRVQRFTTQLEQYDRALHILRGVTERPAIPAARVTVFALDTTDDVARLAGRSGIAGFYDARVSGPVAFISRTGEGGEFGLRAQTILLHEYAHHFMFLNWSAISFPLWFVEGFAEFHATAMFNKDGSVTFGAVPLYRAVGVLSDSMPVARLLTTVPAKLKPQTTETLYGRGWLLTHYLTFSPTRQGQLDQYLTVLNSAKAADAGKVFGKLDKLDNELDAYARRSRLPVVTVAADRIKIGPVAVASLAPGAAAIMPALIRSRRGVSDRESARTVATLARRLARPFPDDPDAQNELAEAEYDAGNFAAAAAACDRALAADPQSLHALLFRGRAAAAIAENANDQNAATWKAVRHWYVEANRLDPDDPQPTMLFYLSFAEEGTTPTRNAEDGLLYAYQLAPYAFDLRLIAAAVMLSRGDDKGARFALQPVAYSAEGGPGAALAASALTAIDSGDKDGALKLLRSTDRSVTARDK